MSENGVLVHVMSDNVENDGTVLEMGDDKCFCKDIPLEPEEAEMFLKPIDVVYHRNVVHRQGHWKCIDCGVEDLGGSPHVFIIRVINA